MHSYFSILTEGVLWGLVLACMIGPVFFGLIQVSIENGWKRALFYAYGVACSDALYVLMAVFGVSPLIRKAGMESMVLLIGGIVLMIFGFLYLGKRSVEMPEVFKEKVQSKSVYKFFLKGFLLNALNPSVFFFWIGPVGFVVVKYEQVALGAPLFLCAALLTVLLTDVLKAWSARRILHWLNPAHIAQLNRIMGLVLLLVGFTLVWQSF